MVPVHCAYYLQITRWHRRKWMIAVADAFTRRRRGKHLVKHPILASLDRNTKILEVGKNGGMEMMAYRLKILTGIMIMDKVFPMYMIGEEARMGHLLAVLDGHSTQPLMND
ncbi:hypothetical protein BKM16_26915 [Pseudomonas amygdali pv. morsprunorum]|nr:MULTISPECIES: hypothetical protein [Pseudomonas syringae group genomosp. 2]EGH01215.1 hypothetical protein PSYAE_04430 [Pseudomonas amygdali pv. aesculi str. 0893_23]KPW20937.1 Uncharacterized protein ALO90_03564 [Pseudomonas amygdali pv. aesculi]MCQ3013828.1 hypothetical protein [Pseudomonas savastanoi]POC98236.1 hypothetical protein BKM22_27090 [Pseudomonas amygdali pv. morsprunorum]POD37477.1 hypothetical protein BKM16_26915 [Pseudomonas amygdali pv. morsprunorum]